jgi:citrate synthase
MARSDRDWISARDAAALLDVKAATLYAYVSRGLVRSQAAPNGRGRRYSRADLERLRARSQARKGHAAVAEGALLFGEPVLDTEVSSIGAAGPLYRGRSAIELAEADVSPERVAELLFTGELPRAAPTWIAPPHAGFERVRSAVRKAEPALHGALLLLAAIPSASVAREHDALAEGRSLVRLVTASLALGNGPRAERAALAASDLGTSVLVALGRDAEPRAVRAVRRALVLCADHELNASTFAARVAAGAGADLPRCLLAALSVFGGSRHGGACDRIESFIDGLGFPERALARVRAQIAEGLDVPGFGHPLYPEGDPRAAPLIAAAEALAPEKPRVRALGVLREAMMLAGADGPTLDHALVALSAALELPAGSATRIFAAGRSVGYVAHALEQRASGKLLRPRARYVGP